MSDPHDWAGPRNPALRLDFTDQGLSDLSDSEVRIKSFLIFDHSHYTDHHCNDWIK